MSAPSRRVATPPVPDLLPENMQQVSYITPFGMATCPLPEDVPDYWPVYPEGICRYFPVFSAVQVGARGRPLWWVSSGDADASHFARGVHPGLVYKAGFRPSLTS
ncbi:hypothetical protein JCGZ_27042 [Jatropha curcas]|uniref:Uncharacterized protein n=1 Tax=Jatropha curcas TaxID=180498 RepID=A0A067JWT7_JATCU|nr:hypothetical protein JCGZ_27042 [Jatropha curcas]